MPAKSRFSTMQRYAVIYAAIFFSVVLVGYIPAFNSNGMLLGLFHIELIDDALHLFSGTWATFAALRSRAAAVFYFKWFGLFYTADAFIGFFTGYTILGLLMLDFGANQEFSITDVWHNLLVNLPHFFLGPMAMYVGHVLSEHVDHKKRA